MRIATTFTASRCGIANLSLSVIICLCLALPSMAIAQAGYSDGDDIAEADSITGPEAPSPVAAVGSSGAEKLFRAAKKRANFAIANIFTSRDIWRGIDWFGNNDPAYLLGGEMAIDLTPYNEKSKRDIWELKWRTMVGGAWGLKSGHEIVDRWKVMTVLENRFFKYIDFDIGYEHYGLPPFDDHDRDFDELLLRAGLNSIPTFHPITLPGYKKPITAIPFGVHYGAYYASSSKNFTWTTDKYGCHGYMNDDWWWHEIAFDLIIPFPDVVPERTNGILSALKLDSAIWLIDVENGLPGLPSGLQTGEFGLSLPLVFNLGKDLNLDNYVWGAFGQSKFIVNPFFKYAIDAKNLDTATGKWNDEDEVVGGVELVYTF